MPGHLWFFSHIAMKEPLSQWRSRRSQCSTMPNLKPKATTYTVKTSKSRARQCRAWSSRHRLTQWSLLKLQATTFFLFFVKEYVFSFIWCKTTHLVQIMMICVVSSTFHVFFGTILSDLNVFFIILVYFYVLLLVSCLFLFGYIRLMLFCIMTFYGCEHILKDFVELGWENNSLEPGESGGGLLCLSVIEKEPF